MAAGAELRRAHVALVTSALVTSALVTSALVTSALAAGAGGPDNSTLQAGHRPPNFRMTAVLVDNWTPCTEISAWELGDLVEGDIMDPKGELKTVVHTPSKKWQNKTLPYLIERNDFTPEQMSVILDVIRELGQNSCLTFREARRGDDFVRITGNKQGCHSHVGRQGGEQVLNLQPPACVERGSVFHGLLHTLGFLHEHNHLLRDDYVRILWPNVQKGKESYFLKVKDTESFGMRYDYGSIMHGSRKHHSMNGRNTIEPHDPLAEIGQRMSPSYFDISKLKLHYECEPKSRTYSKG